jgi:intracellular septation protein A
MADPLAVSPNLIPAPEPGGEFSFKQMIPTLVFDVAMPIVAFNVLVHYGVSTLWALVAGGLFPALNNLRVWVKSRRLEPLGIIVMTFLVIGTAASLISGSVFFALIKESFLTATFGFICLGSLMTERPLMFYINRQFVAGDDPVRLEWWNGLWEYPAFSTSDTSPQARARRGGDSSTLSYQTCKRPTNGRSVAARRTRFADSQTPGNYWNRVVTAGILKQQAVRFRFKRTIELT